VRALRLQDIEWRQGRIRFRSHKRGKEVLVPVTDQVGEALPAYLRHGRPNAPYQEVFLTAHAPIRPLKTPSALSVLVGQRMVRTLETERPYLFDVSFTCGVTKTLCQYAFRFRVRAVWRGSRPTALLIGRRSALIGRQSLLG
jgi:integrase